MRSSKSVTQVMIIKSEFVTIFAMKSSKGGVLRWPTATIDEFLYNMFIFLLFLSDLNFVGPSKQYKTQFLTNFIVYSDRFEELLVWLGSRVVCLRTVNINNNVTTATTYLHFSGFLELTSNAG